MGAAVRDESYRDFDVKRLASWTRTLGDATAQAQFLARQRRLGVGSPSAVAASLACAVRWPLDSLARRYLSAELVERAEARASAPPEAFAEHLLGADPTRFAAAVNQDVAAVSALLEHAAGLCGERPDPGPPPEELIARLGSCAELAPAIVRLRAAAAERLRRFPPRGRVRALLVTAEGDGLVATLGLERVERPARALARPACDEVCEAMVAAALGEDAATTTAALLDYPLTERVDGPSLGLAVAVAARNARVPGADALTHLAVTGGSPEGDPFGVLELASVDAKLAAVARFNELVAYPVHRVVLPAGQLAHEVVAASPIPLDLIGSADAIDQRVLPLTERVGALRRRWRPEVARALRLPAAAVELLDAFAAGDELALFLRSDSGTGKTTACRAMAARWNAPDSASRRLALVTSCADGFEASAVSLARELGTTECDDATEAIVAIAEAVDALRARVDVAVWFAMRADTAPDLERVPRVLQRAHDALRARGLDRVLRLVVPIRSGAWDSIATRAGDAGIRSAVYPLFDDTEIAALAAERGGAIPDRLTHVYRFGFAWRAAQPTAGSPFALASDLAEARLTDGCADIAGARDHVLQGLDTALLQVSTCFPLPADLARRLAADGFVEPATTPDSYRLADHWVFEHWIGRVLSDRAESATPEAAARWLRAAERDPGGNPLSLWSALVLALQRRMSRSATTDPLRPFTVAQEPLVVRAAVAAALDLHCWVPGAEDDALALVEDALRAAGPEQRVEIVRQAARRPTARGLLAHGLRDPDERVMNASRKLLQLGIRELSADDAGGSSKERARRALAPVVEQARVLPRVGVQRGPLRKAWNMLLSVPSLLQPVRLVFESCIVALTEAARTNQRDFYRACTNQLGALLLLLRQRSWRIAFALSRQFRPIFVWAAGRWTYKWLDATRSHNPFRHPKGKGWHPDFPAFFSQPAALRRALEPAVAFAARETALTTSGDLHRITDIARAIHARAELAYAPVNTVLEGAWGTLPVIDDPASATSIVRTLGELFDETIGDRARHAFAQSCLFSMFRVMWHAATRSPELCEAPLEVYELHVERWLAESRWGEYTTASRTTMRIMHLFRLAALSRRIRSTSGPVVERHCARAEAGAAVHLDEIMHLAYEFGDWSEARRLAGLLLDHAGGPEASKPAREAYAHKLRQLHDDHPEEARRWELPNASLDAHLTEPLHPSPLLGVTLAMEEPTYTLLATDGAFRKRYAEWLAGAYEDDSPAEWFRRALRLTYTTVFEQQRP